jgi:hypothetical protein
MGRAGQDQRQAYWNEPREVISYQGLDDATTNAWKVNLKDPLEADLGISALTVVYKTPIPNVNGSAVLKSATVVSYEIGSKTIIVDRDIQLRPGDKVAMMPYAYTQSASFSSAHDPSLGSTLISLAYKGVGEVLPGSYTVEDFALPAASLDQHLGQKMLNTEWLGCAKLPSQDGTPLHAADRSLTIEALAKPAFRQYLDDDVQTLVTYSNRDGVANGIALPHVARLAIKSIVAKHPVTMLGQGSYKFTDRNILHHHGINEETGMTIEYAVAPIEDENVIPEAEFDRTGTIIELSGVDLSIQHVLVRPTQDDGSTLLKHYIGLNKEKSGGLWSQPYSSEVQGPYRVAITFHPRVDGNPNQISVRLWVASSNAAIEEIEHIYCSLDSFWQKFASQREIEIRLGNGTYGHEHKSHRIAAFRVWRGCRSVQQLAADSCRRLSSEKTQDLVINSYFEQRDKGFLVDLAGNDVECIGPESCRMMSHLEVDVQHALCAQVNGHTFESSAISSVREGVWSHIAMVYTQGLAVHFTDTSPLPLRIDPADSLEET